MMGDQTVGLYQHTTATCAAGIIGTTTLQSCGCLHAPAAGGLRATFAVALSSIQKSHSVEIARSISSTSGGLVETRAQIREQLVDTRTPNQTTTQEALMANQ